MSFLTATARRRRACAAFLLAVFAAVGGQLSAQQAVPGGNINMVSGTSFPDGDPYLQRQNEPSAAVSTRNQLHMMAGANDYRTVDLPGPFDPMRGFKMAADAWLGLFKSTDGGQNWTSTLLPGFPQDVSPEGLASPIKGREGATDPVMRSGTNGLFYFAGVAFDRGANTPSSIFVARYMDLNNMEAGDPFGYVDTRLVDFDFGTRFLDKVALATDIPRGAATCTITSRLPDVATGDPATHVQTIPAGNVYVAYAAFTGSGPTEQSVIMLSRSTNCGATWSAPLALSTGSRLVQNPQIAVSPTDGAVYVSWRRFKYSTQDDAVMVVKSINGGATFSKPLRVSGVRPFDQQTEPTRFRSNGFQTMAVDATGRVYLAWPDRGYATARPDPIIGDSRIVIATSTTGSAWSVPRAIQPGGVGHQLMPAMTFHGGKLRILYYDLREDVSQLFGQWIDEAPILGGAPPRIRHTMDVFVAQAPPGSTPAFTTARVSEYASGFLPGSTVEQRLQFNPPNLPLFRQGAVPFMGDYIDLAPAPPFILNDEGTWSFNTGASGTTVSHAVWTDNRDVRPPADGNWANYTPVTSDAVGAVSRFDPTQLVPGCAPGQVGMRNQNIYTARVTDGLFVSAPGNNKSFNGFQRAFVIVAENASAQPRTYRLRIENQPAGGQASFLQFGPPLTTLDVATPALSSVARSVFATASAQDPNPRIRVSVTEVNGIGGPIVTGGLTGTVVLNPDPQNPVLQNPVLQNPVLQNPVLQNISQGESYNPGISAALVGVPNLQNPVLQNPNLQNPNLQNPSIQNPHLQNPNLQNPNLQNPVLQNDAVANPSIVNAELPNPVLQNPVLQNPNLQNPTLQNPNLQNAGFSDTNWLVTNEGNTTASYTVNLLLNNPVPAGFATQLLLHKTFTTPAADGCELKEQAHTILLANIPNPVFITDPANPNLQNPNLQNPNLQNPTLALAPGESATITFRVLDPNIFDGVTYDASAAVTPATVAQSVNSVDVAAGLTAPPVAIPLTIVTSEIPPTTPGAPINRTLQMVAARGVVTCSVVAGDLPAGVTLSPTGTLSGTPAASGNYSFTVECVDSGPPVRRDRQTLSIQVNPAAPIGFDSVWNGLDTNWYNPANWSPRGVPTATSRVYFSAATSVVPRLTASVTVRDLFLEPGAQLDTNGFTLTVTNNADAGRTIIGAGRTVLTGSGGNASGVFNNLEIQGRISLNGPVTTTGTLTLGAGARLELNGQPLIVGGQLITDVSEGALPVIVGASNNVFLATGVNVNGLVLNNAPLTSNAGALTRFDNVSFSGFAPESVQLTVNNPGLATHFPMTGLSFSTQPASGQYIQANDTLATGPPLILDVIGAVPADGTAFSLTTGGAIVNWLANPGEANLAVTQTVAPVPAAAGTRLNYVITVTNGGPAGAQNVVLNPGVPFGATGVITATSPGVCSQTSGVWSCVIGTLAPGASSQTSVSFLTTAIGTLFTTASVSSSTPDAVIANNFHTIGAVIVGAGQGVDLRLTKADSIDPVALNAPFTYTLTATNVGTTVATNVVVTDNVPAGISIAYATSASGMCSAISGQVICSFASLAPAETVTMTFNAVGTTVGAWTNQASVTAAQVELTPADNVATQTTMVVATVNCAAPSFSGPAIFAANGPTGDVLSGDLNGDGFKDLVLPVPSANSVAVLLGNGTGTFGTPTLYPTGTGTHEGVILDLNGDGSLDIALEGFFDAFVLFGNGSGGFGAPATISYSPAIVGDVRAGDFNGDGRPDLAITTLGPNHLHVRLNNGSGAFIETVTPTALPGEADRIVVRDLNGDGRADVTLSYTVFTPGQAANFVSVLLGDGAGGFVAPATLPLAPGAQGRVFDVGDINGDTHIDLAVVEILPGSRTVYLLAGNGAGSFAPQALTSALTGAFRVEAGEINGDGLRDLAISSGGVLHVFLGAAAGAFEQPSAFSIPFGLNFQFVDLNGDNRLDIASALNQGNGVAILLNGCGQPAGNLILSAADSPDPVAEGATLTYSSTVANGGDTLAANVTLTQTLSSLGAAGTATPSQGICTVAGRLVTCNLGPLAPNASANVQVTFTPSTGGSLTGVIGVGSERPDSTPADNVVTLTTAVTAAGRQLVVTNTNNAGAGSLRQAILDSNADSGDRDEIVFNIPASGVQTIVPLTALPAITQPVVIDGTTQPGFAGTPLIELNGNGLAANGLVLSGGNSIVRGLVINRFTGTGIVVQLSSANVIEGNYIGTDASGTVDQGNAGDGITLSGASGTLVGGTTPASRNVVSGNSAVGIRLSGAATANVIRGNYLGVNAPGSAAIPNTGSGIALEGAASGNIIGGAEPGAGNLISGNGGAGLTLSGPTVASNIVIGNRIGTDDFATTSIANGSHGISITDGFSNVIGGVAAGTGNVISGNAGSGVSISGSPANSNVLLHNLIGTNGSGMSAIGNAANGVVINSSPGNTIGVADLGNVISGNGGNGIAIFGAASIGNQISGNRIGANFQATGSIPNSGDGIRVDGAAATIIGGANASVRNIVGGNVQHGIALYGGATGTQIAGNTVGSSAPLTFLGNNLEGIQVYNGSNTTIGGPTAEHANLISRNGRTGVVVIDGTANAVIGNRIFGNSSLGLDLFNDGVTANDTGDADTGANNGQNFPLLTGVVGGVTGTLNSTAGSGFLIQFYGNTTCDTSQHGEGETFLGTSLVLTDASGNATIPLFPAQAGQIVTATATSGNGEGDTSEFAACVTVPAAAPQADLALTMTGPTDPVAFGAPFSYVITAQNLGPNPATGVVITDTLPTGVSFTSALSPQGECNLVNRTVTCTIPSLGIGGVATVTIAVTGMASGTVTNTASIAGAQPDPVSGNNSDSEETTIQLASCSAVTFTGPRPFAGSAGEMGPVRLVDMNHDGRLDAVATHETNLGGVDVFLNDGAGGFAAPRFTSTPSPWWHVVADFNGDTHPDVITASESNTPVHQISLRLLTNDGTGTLTLVPGFSLPFEGTFTAVDIDRDGDQDLAIIIGNDLILRRNDGQANFGAAETIIAGMAGWPAFGDFNGDNRTDVAVGIGTPGVAVALANASGGFLAPVVHAVPGGAHGLADPADLNGDGRLDLFTIAGDENEPAPGASVLLGDGAGGFGGAVQATTDFVYLPTLADVNGDGRPDLVGISSLGSFGVWLGNGGGTFSAPVHFANAVYYGPAVGDLNGDGRPDLATGDINGTLNVFFNNCGAAPVNLTVALAESADPVNEGGELTYTVTVTNLTGTAATGVRLTGVLGQLIADDPVVPSVTVLGATSSVGGTLTTIGATHLWTVPTLAANSAATFTFGFRPLAGGPLEFSAGVTSDGAETDPSDNGARESTIVNVTGSTLTVTTTADSGPGSLRQAIETSNADSGDRDTIVFDIPGAGVPTITLQTPLDSIEQPVIIDGTSQPDTHLVELNGNGLTATGLFITGGNSIVRGMVVNRFGNAISLQGNGGNVVEGSFIGTDPTGTLARPNVFGGIRVSSAGNRIGGLTAAARNVISGNSVAGISFESATATVNVVQGNYIGLNAAGAAALANSAFSGAIQIFNGASNNTIGGTVAGAGNVISGNVFAAIGMTGGADNLIQGNFIGTDPTGAVRIANGGTGVDIASAQRTIVGGPGLARNVISGNATGILLRSGASGTLVQNNYIGLNAAGSQALANTSHGIDLNGVSGTIVGGTAAGAGNVISGNGAYGIRNLAGSTGTVVLGNRIGTNAAGSGPVANSLSGLFVDGNGMRIGGTAAGEANIIAHNALIGVFVAGGSGHAVVGNSIFSNGELGIDVGPAGVTPNDPGDGDTGANNLQNFPVLSGVTGGVQGTLNSTPNTSFRVHYFSNAVCDASGNGEGQTYLGETTLATDAEGNATLAGFSAAVGTIVTATATSAATNDTSEFSACVTVPPSADLSVVVSDSADPVTVGQAFNYVLVAGNSGPVSATSVVVTNTLPTGVTATSAVSTLGSCTMGDRTITCTIGTLASGGSATVTIGVSGVMAGLVTNSASISGAQLDPVPGNNTDTEDTTITLASCAAPSYSGPVRLNVPAFDSLFVEQADLNGDGRNDLVVSMLAGGLAVRLNQGGGNFAAAVPVALPGETRGFALVDLDRDGRIDIAAVTESGLHVLIGAGDGTFGTAATYQHSASNPISVTAADLDTDGDIDLIVDALDSGDDVMVFRNNGTGAFAAGVDVQTTTEEPVFPVVSDLNRDGHPDIAVGSATARFSVLLADGAGGYLPATGHGANGAYVIRGAADLDGDGNIDLVAQFVTDTTLQVVVLRGDGNGGFDAGTDVGAGPTALSLRLADVNGDGRSDLVAHHPTRQTVAVQLGQAGGSFAAPVHFPAPYSIHPATGLDDDGAAEDFYSVPSIGDLNGDGQLDIAVGDASGAIQVLFSTCGQPAGDLSVAVQESADPVTEGASFSYSVVVTNHGPATTSGATVHLAIDGPPGARDAAPARFTAGTGASCVVADQHITCAVPPLESTGTLTLQATVSTLAGTTLTFGASVTSSNFDPTPANNSAFETTTVTPSGRNLEVTNTNDSGPGSLRNAIAESNADSGDRDTIVFNIPGAGVPAITLQSQLGPIDQPVVIDGTTQPTTALVELNGNGLPATGLVISGGNSVVRGLVINRFAGDAISLEGNGGNVVEGNRIGTDPTGTLARPNGTGGIRVFSANNRIGGLTPAARNVISGNQSTGVTLQSSTATGNIVQGNYIGITAAGLAALPNTNSGVSFFNGASANTIGGAAGGAGNVISGNTGLGINVTSGSNGNTIQGNFIGLDAAGTFDLGNTGDGISVSTVSGTIIGGNTAGARNVVSGNNNVGIRIIGAAATGNLIRGNYIGVNASGGASVGNTNGGITIQTSATANVIGGAGVGEGNLISGNLLNGINLTTAASGNTIQGNLVGVDAAGNADLGNSGDGINIAGVSGTIVGGTSSGARNVVSGNNNVGIRINGATATGNQIRGNYVGVNGSGGAAVGNTNGGITVQNSASGNTIGGSGAGEGNLISGNTTRGIFVQSASNTNVIQGNLIGVDATGATALGNTTDGIGLNSVSGTIIGGTTAAARNVISGNTTGIQLQTGATSTLIQGNRIGTNAAGTAAVPNGAGINVSPAHGNTIGGTAAGAGNLVSGNTGNGIWINAANDNLVQGNLIGTNAAGTGALPNGFGMFVMGAGNTVGGTTAGAGNVISGNANIGISVAVGATATVLQGNRIGTNAAGTISLANGSHGVFLDGSGTTVGGTVAAAANIIANNGAAGVRVNSGTGHAVLGNSIFSNGNLGIDLGTGGVTANDAGDADTGANHLQNFPVLAATSGGVLGTLNSTPSSTFTIEYFGNAGCDSSGNGEGQAPLGSASVTTNSSGNATLAFFEAPAGQVVTATATSPGGDTSEFSSCVTVLLGPTTFTVGNTSNSGPGSLRQAILDANARVNTRDIIAFNIPGAGPHSIVLQTPLPMITDSVIIDGASEPDYVAGTPVIELDGSSLADAYGLHVTASFTTIRGLVINGFGTPAGSTQGVGIQLENSTGHLIEGNFIGTDVTGMIARPNRNVGIGMFDVDTSTIGGTTAASRNVISGNGASGISMTAGSTQNIVSGNYIGLNRLGTSAVGNGLHGVSIAFNSNQNGVGSGIAGGRNVISGNGGDGINVFSASRTLIIGNYVGTDVTGSVDLGNAGRGVYIQSAGSTVIGDVNGNGNVISGNNAGVQVDASANAQVSSNFVGVNAAGTGALGNSTHGITISNSSTSANVLLNVVSANGGNGVVLSASASLAAVHGNVIGVPLGGAATLGNTGHGILISNSSQNTIGSVTNSADGNLIRGNGANGIALVAPATPNVIRRNSIVGNLQLGIDLANNGVTANDAGDLDTGVNNLQNFPVLASAVGGVTGSLNSRPSLSYAIEYSANTACDPSGNGEGETFLGTVSVATNTDGIAILPLFAVDPGVIVTATATAPTGETSEFSACVTAASTNRAPAANAGPDQSVIAGTVVQLTGAASSDPDGNPLTYAWTLTRPAGSGTTLSSATAAAPAFLADVPGVYTARLIVSDAEFASAPDDVVVDAAAPRTAGLIGSYFGGVSQLNGAGLPIVPATLPTFVRSDPALQFGSSRNFNYRPCLLAGSGCLNGAYTVRWVGRMDLQSGSYTFALNSSDASQLFIGGTSVVSNPGRHAAATAQDVYVSPGPGSYPIEVRFTTNGTTPGIDLLYQPPSSGTTYTFVSYPSLQNGYTLTGTITTNGALGAISGSDVTGWTWTATNGVRTITASGGGLLPTNSVGLFASATELSVDGIVGQVVFQGPPNTYLQYAPELNQYNLGAPGQSAWASPGPGGQRWLIGTAVAAGLTTVPATLLWSDGTFLDSTTASAVSTVSFSNPATPPAPGGSAPVASTAATVSFMNPASVPEPGGTAPVASTSATVSYANPAAVAEPGGSAPVAATNTAVSYANPAPVPEPGGTAPVAATTATVSFENPEPTIQPGGTQAIAAPSTAVGFASGPVVSSIAPRQLSRGAGGGQLTLSGSNLQNATAVSFDNTPGISASAPAVSADGRTVTVTVSINGAAATGSVVVTVTTPSGTSAGTAATVLEIVQ